MHFVHECPGIPNKAWNRQNKFLLIRGSVPQNTPSPVNAPPAERVASGSPLEGGEDIYLDLLIPKSLAQNWIMKYWILWYIFSQFPLYNLFVYRHSRQGGPKHEMDRPAVRQAHGPEQSRRTHHLEPGRKANSNIKNDNDKIL